MIPELGYLNSSTSYYEITSLCKAALSYLNSIINK